MRARQGVRRRHVAPWTDQQFLLALQSLEHAKRVVSVAVGPTGHDHRRALDPFVAGSHRSVPPVRAVELLLHPGEQPWFVLGDSCQPLVAPSLAPDGGDGRQRVHRDHVVAVVDEVDRPQCSAHVVHVVGVSVVGGVDRADRTERRRALAGELQGVEARVAVTEHPDPAVAPGLGGEPGDDVSEIVELGERVFVGRPPGGRAGAADVQPANSEPTFATQPQVVVRMRVAGQVVLAIRQGFQQSWRRVSDPRAGTGPRPVACRRGP